MFLKDAYKWFEKVGWKRRTENGLSGRRGFAVESEEHLDKEIESSGIGGGALRENGSDVGEEGGGEDEGMVG